MSYDKPKLTYTKDLSIFQMHELNRDLSDKPALEESLKTHGFMPSSPIQCVRGSGGKLKIVRGHHRFHYAKRLGLGVWYVIDPTVTDIFELEGDASSRWSITDFVRARAKAKDINCIKVLEYQKRHGVTLGAAISLMKGEAAGSNNGLSMLKRGTFRVTDDTQHAELVGMLVDFCREHGASFAGQSAFVSAISKVCMVPEFEPMTFMQRVQKMPSLLCKRSTLDAYLSVIEDAYNYGAKAKRFPLVFRAKEVARERHPVLGRTK